MDSITINGAIYNLPGDVNDIKIAADHVSVGVFGSLSPSDIFPDGTEIMQADGELYYIFPLVK